MPALYDDLDPAVRPKIVRAAGFSITVTRRKHAMSPGTAAGRISPVIPAVAISTFDARFGEMDGFCGACLLIRALGCSPGKARLCVRGALGVPKGWDHPQAYRKIAAEVFAAAPTHAVTVCVRHFPGAHGGHPEGPHRQARPPTP
jgi:hypothetical protein